MGAIEMLLIGLGAIVGTVTLLESPPDVMLDDITVPKIMEERGFSPDVLAELLDDEGQLIYSKSNRDDFSLRLNYQKSAISQFAVALKIREVVKALHSVFRMVDGRISLMFLANEETGEISVVVDLLQISSGQVLKTTEVTGHIDEVEELIGKIMDFMVQHITPYAYAIHLFHEDEPIKTEFLSSIEVGSRQRYKHARTFVENWIVQNEYEPLVVDHWSWAKEGNFQTTKAFMFNLLGVINLREGNLKKASQSLIHAIDLDDSVPHPYINMARLLQIEENPEMALLYLEEAEALEPQYAITKLYSALAHHQIGRNEKALEDVQEAISRQSNFAPAHDLRAKILAESGADQTIVTRSKRQANLSRWRKPNQLHDLAI